MCGYVFLVGEFVVCVVVVGGGFEGELVVGVEYYVG